MKNKTIGKYKLELWTDEKGYFNVKVYNTNRKNKFMPDKWYYFKTEEERSKYIRQLEGIVKTRQEEKLARKKERKQFKTSLKPGDIISNSWGYDQTNVAFFKILEVTSPKRVIVQKIGSMLTDNSDYGSMGGTTVPNQDSTIGEPFKCSVLTNDWVRVNKYYTFEDASKWDGRPCYTSWGH